MTTEFFATTVKFDTINAEGMVLNSKKSIPEPGTCMLPKINSDDLLCVLQLLYFWYFEHPFAP